jgi:hypothetical protein
MPQSRDPRDQTDAVGEPPADDERQPSDPPSIGEARSPRWVEGELGDDWEPDGPARE